MGGKVDAVVLGCGTCGTFTGVARYMKEHMPAVLAVAVTTQGSVLGGGAAGPHKVEGIGNNFIPETFDPAVCDEVIAVTDENAFAMVKTTGRSGRCVGGIEWRRGCVRFSAGGASDWAQENGWRQLFQTRRSAICRRRYLRVGFRVEKPKAQTIEAIFSPTRVS